MKICGGLDKTRHFFWVSVIDQGTDYNKNTKGLQLEGTR
jgi:hypothetical protein